MGMINDHRCVPPSPFRWIRTGQRWECTGRRGCGAVLTLTAHRVDNLDGPTVREWVRAGSPVAAQHVGWTRTDVLAQVHKASETRHWHVREEEIGWVLDQLVELKIVTFDDE